MSKRPRTQRDHEDDESFDEGEAMDLVLTASSPTDNIGVPAMPPSPVLVKKPRFATTDPTTPTTQDVDVVTTRRELPYAHPVVVAPRRTSSLRQWPLTRSDGTGTRFVPSASDDDDIRAYQDEVHVHARYTLKGGVGKTTSSFATACELAMTERVLLVDADSQRNATQLCLNRTVASSEWQDKWDDFFRQPGYIASDVKRRVATLYDAMQGLSVGRDLVLPILTFVPLPGAPMVNSQCQPGRNNGLFLLPGDIRLPELDTLMAKAAGDPMASYLVKVFGAFWHLILMVCYTYGITQVVVDLSPAPSTLNKVIIMSSHTWACPVFPDFFSTEAVSTLASNLDSSDEDRCWLEWWDRIRKRCWRLERSNGQAPAYLVPEHTSVFIGGIITRYQRAHNRTGGAMVMNQAFWLRHVNAAIIKLFKALPPSMRSIAFVDGQLLGRRSVILGSMEEFHQLQAISHRESLPVGMLVDADLKKPCRTSAKLQPIAKRGRELLLTKIERIKASNTRIVTRLMRLAKRGGCPNHPTPPERFPTCAAFGDPLDGLRAECERANLRVGTSNADGECQFHSIGQLIGENAATVRKAVVQWLEEHRDTKIGDPQSHTTLSHFVDGQSFDDYVLEMRKPHTWGDHVTLFAAASVYNVLITVYSSQEGSLPIDIFPHNVIPNVSINLGHIPERHFVPLHPSEKGNADTKPE